MSFTESQLSLLGEKLLSCIGCAEMEGRIEEGERHQLEEFVAALLKRVVELGEQLEEIRQYGEMYCPKCGSCGIGECCPPTKCEFVKGCLHGKGLLKQHEDFRNELFAAEQVLGKAHELTSRAEAAEEQKARLEASLREIAKVRDRGTVRFNRERGKSARPYEAVLSMGDWKALNDALAALSPAGETPGK